MFSEHHEEFGVLAFGSVLKHPRRDLNMCVFGDPSGIGLQRSRSTLADRRHHNHARRGEKEQIQYCPQSRGSRCAVWIDDHCQLPTGVLPRIAIAANHLREFLRSAGASPALARASRDSKVVFGEASKIAGKGARAPQLLTHSFFLTRSAGAAAWDAAVAWHAAWQ